MKKRVLLKDIAKVADVTINTVSRALNDKDDISESKKAEIKKIALELGYIPDAVASSLRSGVSNTIGIIFDNITNPYFMIMTEIVYQELKKEGYQLMIFTDPGEDGKFGIGNFNEIASRRIDGIISFLRPTEEVADLSKKNKIPIVILGREGDDVGIDSVFTDDFLGGKLVGEHLIEGGRKNVGYIGVPSSVMCSYQRAMGLASAYEQTGVFSHEENIVYLDREETKLEEVIDSFINSGKDAIFCFNDSLAYKTIRHLNNKGIKVPEDVSVVGYDNIEDFFHFPTNLTTVDTDKIKLANKSIEMLKSRLSNFNSPIQKEVLPTKLIERATT